MVPLVADAGESVCTARVSARSTARAGDRVRLAVAADRFFFFDLETGRAIQADAPVTA